MYFAKPLIGSALFTPTHLTKKYRMCNVGKYLIITKHDDGITEVLYIGDYKFPNSLHTGIEELIISYSSITRRMTKEGIADCEDFSTITSLM